MNPSRATSPADQAADDRQLVASVLARAPGAFERLVSRHQALVWHLVYRMVQHPEDARELSQDVFLRVHERLVQFRAESSLATWIGRVAFSVATRHLQRKRLPMADAGADEDASPAWERVADDFDLARFLRPRVGFSSTPPYPERCAQGDKSSALHEERRHSARRIPFRLRIAPCSVFSQ